MSSSSACSDAYAQVRIGDPLETGTLMGPLIDREAREQFRDTIAELQASTVREILCGGETLERARILRAADAGSRPKTIGRACSAKPSRRFCT